MKRFILLPALLILALFLLSAPAFAQTVRIAKMVNIADTGQRGTPSTAALAVHNGFPNLDKPLPEIAYPVKAQQFQIEGRVLVEFTVSKKGHAKNVKIISGPGGGCKDEVKRVLHAARFVPTLNAEGRPVAARFVSAFDFRLK